MTRIQVERSCGHERSQIVDSCFHGGGYATDRSRAIFCDTCRLQRWLDVEATLAESQAHLGIIPRDAAEQIRRCARIELLDSAEIARGIKSTGHSLIALIRALERACGGYAGQFVHHGATTQDIQDTGMVLEMRDVLDAAESSIARVVRLLVPLARENRQQLMIGRTHARPALPYTFGLKVASWLDELLRHVTRIREARPRLLVAQLHGAAGTMAGFGDDGPALLEEFASRLSLYAPMTCWHSSRDRVAEYVTLLASVTGTLARMAEELRTLGRPEFGEVGERWPTGQISSSTMPHKRNPEVHEQVVVLARLVRALVPLVLEGMILEHERDYRGVRTEWVSVTDASHYALAALSFAEDLASRIEVNGEFMTLSARECSEALCTEALMLRLGRRVGKQRAFQLLYESSQSAQDARLPFRQVIGEHLEIKTLLGDDELARVLEPEHYLGAAVSMVDAVLLNVERLLPEAGSSAD